ncbi:hypothetical protein JCM10213_003982 [Rhodosporidiobolus nylandii]
MSQPRSRASSLSRPTTPLRRLSHSSLRAASLSHSLSRSQSAHPSSAFEPPLAHLAPSFVELAHAVADLTANMERLEEVDRMLGETNEAFAAWLLGLRANGYTVDFLEAPTKQNFELALERAQAQAATFAAQQASTLSLLSQPSSPPRSPSRQAGGGAGNDTTFVTNDEASFISNADEVPVGRSGSAAGRGRGRGGSVRGGAPAARGRGGKGAPVGKRRKEEMAAFADPILPLLPITLRENRRQECEKVLWALKERPGGAAMADLVTALSAPGSPTQAVPQVRINEVLLALVRAKVVGKGLVKGVAQYRLDPSKVAA